MTATTTQQLKLSGLTRFQIEALVNEGYALTAGKTTAVVLADRDGNVPDSWHQLRKMLDDDYVTFRSRQGAYHARLEAESMEQPLQAPSNWMQTARRGHMNALASVVRKVAALADAEITPVVEPVQHTTKKNTTKKEQDMTTTKTTKTTRTTAARKAAAKKAPAKTAAKKAAPAKAPAKKGPSKDGLQRTVKAHETGGEVTSTRHEKDGQKVSWTLKCNHGTKLAAATVSDVKVNMAHPSAWCGQCKKDAAAKAKASA